jgi:hypothetical protein
MWRAFRRHAVSAMLLLALAFLEQFDQRHHSPHAQDDEQGRGPVHGLPPERADNAESLVKAAGDKQTHKIDAGGDDHTEAE